MARLETDSSGVVLNLESHEAVVVEQLLDDMIEFISHENSDDDVEKRLFPDAFDDEDEAQKFKEMVGSELRAEKLKALELMRAGIVAGGGRTTLSPADVEAWLRGLNDLRLAIGTRLDVTEEKMADIPDEDDPASVPLGLVHWLGWLQEMMIDSLTRLESPDDRTDEGDGGA
jgi:Domain of unknown function (DUF2017)